MNLCPVCGFWMKYPPRDFHICPSCGTEFGYDDSGTSYEELRRRWLTTGPAWWSPVDPAPAFWNPHEQLRNLMLNAPSGRASLVIDANLVMTQGLGIISAKHARRKHLRRVSAPAVGFSPYQFAQAHRGVT